MTEAIEVGHFFVGELADGKLVAASNSAPFFCFRADSEAELFALVGNALEFYHTQSERLVRKAVIRPAATLNHWRNKRSVDYKELASAAA
jgi:hypothetical protein